jgi:hypothetical protein
MIFRIKPALLLSNLSLMVIDTKAGVTRVVPEIQSTACRDIILVASQCEGSFLDIPSDALKFGLGEPE